MPQQDHISEILEYPKNEFAQHLGQEYNHRILFSGRFGIGKTTFLKYFFEESEYRKEYNAVHLFPVNYQVSDNKDIFEYIKYDIIAHLLSVEEIKLEKIDIPAFTTIAWKLINRPSDVLSPILHMLSGLPLAGGVGKAYDNVKTLYEQLNAEHKEICKESDEEKMMLSFLEEVEKQKGGVYENDFYTQLIVSLLQRWKGAERSGDNENEPEVEGNRGKKNVLIVDDLDRIDPQHAFRLFNIFAAHFDQQDEQVNKFGFDKVVFVCDVQNIRNIFAHNYGSEVNFSGYIDKFFSTRVYQFDNAEAVTNIVQSTVEKAIFLESSPYNNVRKQINGYLTFFISAFVQSGLINLRALFKIAENYDISHRNRQFGSVDTKVESYKLLVVITLDVLAQIMGSSRVLLDALGEVEESDKIYSGFFEGYNINWLLGQVIAFLGYKYDTREGLKYELPEEKLVVKYFIKDSHSGSVCSAEITDIFDEEGNRISGECGPNIFMMHRKVLQKMIAKGY